MVGALVKLVLSLAAGGIGLYQHQLERSVGAVFCFILCGLLFLGCMIDVFFLLRQKFAKASQKDSASSPALKDYPHNPDPAELKIGKTYRAADVEQYLDNIRSLAENNPEYELSESEIVDRYLTDKKIWKYLFKPRTVTLVPESQHSAEGSSLGVFTEGKQIGSIRACDKDHISEAMEKTGVEVVYCSIGGGACKVVQTDVHTGKFSLKEDEAPYCVTLSIRKK